MSRAGRRVLIVDDDEGVLTAVGWALEADGFLVETASNGLDALESIQRNRPDLMVLDLSMPGLGGLDVLERVRAAEQAGTGAPLPIIVLSGRNSEGDRITGLDLGADDYLVKPFSPGELAARVRSVLRRSQPTAAPATAPRGVVLDRSTRDVSVDGVAIDLTAKEFDLLAFLADRPRLVFSRQQLLVEVWASEPGWQSEATVTEHIHRLRQKLEDNPRQPKRLKTVRGVGYRWEP